jgi:hypothetical protein
MTTQDPNDRFEEEVRAAYRRHLDELEPLIPTSAPAPAGALSRDLGAGPRPGRPAWTGSSLLKLGIVAVAGLIVAALVAPAMIRTGPASPSLTAGSVSSPSALPQGVAGPWTRLAPWPAAAGEFPKATLAAWHDGFAAIDESGPNPVVWFSGAGRDWKRVPDAEAEFAGVDVVWLVGAPGGFVAAGTARPTSNGSSPAPTWPEGAQRACGGGAWWSVGPCRLWFSADGLSWRELNTGSLFANAGVVGIAGGPKGVVVIGFPTGFQPVTASVWYSADGSDWRTVALSAPMQYAGTEGVAAGPNGFEIVGMPEVTDIANSILPAAWSSPDGLAWTRATMATDYQRDQAKWLGSVFIGPAGMVAVYGGGLESVGVQWQSADGSSWQWSLPGVTPLIADGGRILGQRFADANFTLSQSLNGIDWTPVPVVPADQVGPSCQILAISPTGLLIGGNACPIRFLAGQS